MRNTYISTYENLKSKNAVEKTLLEWLQDTSKKDFISHIRSLTNKDEIRKLKSMLPCATISGTFSARKTDAFIKHSGYICIDIDGKENESITDFSLLRDELKNIINVSYASISVSGNGVFCLIPIRHTDKHKEHFKALQECFLKLGIVIDKACSDITRLRIISYDPDAYINEDALPFDEVLETKNSRVSAVKKDNVTNVKTTRKASTNTKTKSNTDNTYNKVMRIITEIEKTGIDMTGSYNDWFNIGCSLANEFGEEGRDLFHTISEKYPSYKPGECDNQFTACLKSCDHHTIGTFFYYAKENGLMK